MRLLGKNRLDDFRKKHGKGKKNPKAGTGFAASWKKAIEETDFKDIDELRKALPTADKVGGKTVFNIGTKVRIITVIQYDTKQVLIAHVLTHDEYNKGKWKE